MKKLIQLLCSRFPGKVTQKVIYALIITLAILLLVFASLLLTWSMVDMWGVHTTVAYWTIMAGICIVINSVVELFMKRS